MGPLFSDTGDSVTDPKNIAQKFKEQYEKANSEPIKKVDNAEDFFIETNSEDKIDDIVFTFREVEEAIDELSVDASAGPNGIPPNLLKSTKKTLSEPLTILWKNL